MTRKILLTGGAGFIGSHLLDRLLAEGYHVTAVDNFDEFYSREAKLDNIAAHRSNPLFELIEVDIRDLAKFRRVVVGGFDTIVHLAARAGVRPSIDDPAGYQAVNVHGTQNLLTIAQERSIRQFVFASSSSVYGINRDVPWREEDHVLRPISPYASTKVSAELLGHVYSHLFGIRFIALRFFTVYGPRQRPDLAIHKFARLMLRGEPLPLYGDGSTSRDYSYVDDVVTGIRSAIDYEESEYEVINLGNNRTVSLAEVIETLESTLGLTARIDRQPEQLGDVPQTWASIAKAESLLKYRPETSFLEGVERFVRWLGPRSEGLAARFRGSHS